MNERIKELELQAYVYVTSEYIDPSNNMPYMWTGKEFSREKFAELIINECVEQCMTDDYKNILNHFGMLIEEDEELEDSCPCGFDGGTTCGAVNCKY